MITDPTTSLRSGMLTHEFKLLDERAQQHHHPPGPLAPGFNQPPLTV
jgi:hypothetical protein